MSSSFEHDPAVSGIHLADLNVPVQSYVKKLHASLMEIYKKYEVSNKKELAEKIRNGSVSVEDRERAIELVTLMRDCGKKNKIVGREFEAPIIEHERQKLKEFFGRDIEVPPLPEEITPERIEQWEKQKLELHYLPPIDMSKEDELKNWIKPNFQNIEKSDLPQDAMVLPGCWVLVDGREKPHYQQGSNQQYKDDQDFLGPVLEELRNTEESPGKYLIKKYRKPHSRFNISPEELEKPEVKAALAKACGLESDQFSLPRMIEFNVLGNIHHPEWGEPPSNCSEWFSDKYMAGRGRLRGGLSGHGGLADVGWRDPGYRYDVVGFRALGRFS